MTFSEHVSRMWERMQTPGGGFRGLRLRSSVDGVVISGSGSSAEIVALTKLARRLQENGDCLAGARVESSRRYDRQGEPEDDDDLNLHLVPAPGRFEPEPQPPPVKRGISVGVLANRRLQAGLNEDLMDACDDIREQIERFGD